MSLPQVTIDTLKEQNRTEGQMRRDLQIINELKAELAAAEDQVARLKENLESRELAYNTLLRRVSELEKDREQERTK